MEEEKKLSLILTGCLLRVHLFVHKEMSILVNENFRCYPKKFKAIIGKNFIYVYDTSLVKYRIYNKMYTRT